MPFEQTNLPITIDTPLGANALLVRSVEGDEAVSGLFHYRLELASENPSLAFADILAKPVTLHVPQSSGDTHYLNGIVTRFVQSGQDQRFAFYSAEIRPWLYLLTMSAGCAIYQNMSAPDIIKQVFQDLGFSDFTDKLTGTYTARDYCVQFRETAFAFISRLMEQEGIFYFFAHDSSSHKMVLADDASAWLSAAGLASANYTQDQSAWTSDLVVTECLLEQNVTPGQFKTDDYNFETPSTDLLASADGTDTSRSIYDYPGLYAAQSDGETIASMRLTALEMDAQRVTGTSLCRAFYAGCKFTLAGHYRSDANADYVISRLTIHADQSGYRNSFEGFPASATYRPALQTPTPVVAGMQPAVVVGKSGEEIWTDQYGRVKVQFFWDQKGQNDEKSSCWIRVAQPWAGKQWGGMFIPRIGQEVLVAYLDGNPDRPVIAGSVYNDAQTVPYALPDQSTKSTIKTSSSKGGSGFNEIRFEDKAGSEELFLQAQKDMTLSVLNNYSATVTGNYTLKVNGDISVEASGAVTFSSGKDFTNKAGTALNNQAGTSLTNQSGTDMTNKAGTTLTNQASASQTVDGGGMLALKGGLVKVN